MSRPHDLFHALLELTARPNCVDDPARYALASEYRSELLVLMVGLAAAGLGVVGGPHPGPPCDCDLCGCNLSKTTPAFVDGKIGPKGWANMCAQCFVRDGRGIGWGIGQLYAQVQGRDGTYRWHLIGGGDPSGELEPTEPWE